MKHLALADQYRQRAKRLRAIAEKWVDCRTKEMLERVACDYERMACRQESLRQVRPLQL